MVDTKHTWYPIVRVKSLAEARAICEGNFYLFILNNKKLFVRVKDLKEGFYLEGKKVKKLEGFSPPKAKAMGIRKTRFI